MLSTLKSVVAAATVTVVLGALAGGAAAQSGQPIKIGFSMAMTGGLAANGKSALLAHEDLGGGHQRQGRAARPAGQARLLRRPEQSLDGAGHLHQAPRRRQGRPRHRRLCDRADRARDADRDRSSNMVFISLLGLAVNSEFHYAELLRHDPARVPIRSRPSPRASSISRWRRRRSRRPSRSSPPTRNSPATPPTAPARTPRRRGSRSSTTRAIRPRPPTSRRSCARSQATNPDLVVICSYPPDSVGMVQAVNEIGFKPKMIGGGMVGLQATALKTQLGPLLNGFVNYDFWLPVPKMQFPGVEDLIKRYQARAAAEGVDPLGYYMAPWAYAQLQVLAAGGRGDQEPRRTRSSPTTSAPTRSRPCSAT